MAHLLQEIPRHAVMNGDIDQYGSISLVLLLSGEKYYPDVNIARDKILSLPLYANLDLSYICTQFPTNSSFSSIGSCLQKLIESKKYDNITEKDYFAFLKENPIWEQIKIFGDKTIPHIRHII